MKKTFFLKCLAIGIFLAACAAVFALFGTYTHPQKASCYLTPLLNNANGWDIYTVNENGHHDPVLEPAALLELAPGVPYYLSRTPTSVLLRGRRPFVLPSFS